MQMDASRIRKYCLSFPHATENLQWEDELCFKVGGKIFAMLGLDSLPQRMCFKCTPERFAELCELEDVRPAPYVGRYQWVMLDRLDALPDDEFEDLIRQSYGMVRSKAKITDSRDRGRRQRKKFEPRGRRHRTTKKR
jgi:predicted DNA-binding protein (MmcQ/YjbR family)